jgi:hypothetical protein
VNIPSIQRLSYYSLCVNSICRRLFADVINDVGQLLDMVSALVPSDFYLLVLSLSAICKGIHLGMNTILSPMWSLIANIPLYQHFVE